MIADGTGLQLVPDCRPRTPMRTQSSKRRSASTLTAPAREKNVVGNIVEVAFAMCSHPLVEAFATNAAQLVLDDSACFIQLTGYLQIFGPPSPRRI